MSKSHSDLCIREFYFLVIDANPYNLDELACFESANVNLGCLDAVLL